MSHRALVAVARGDGRYDVYYSHDGGTDERLCRLSSHHGKPPPDLLEGAPLARGVSFEQVLVDQLDPIEHEALLVVECDGDITPYVALPYVLATADGLSEWEPRGVVIGLVGRDGALLRPAYVRGWFQGTADVLGEAVDAGLVASEEAFDWLHDSVRRLAGDRHPLSLVP